MQSKQQIDLRMLSFTPHSATRADGPHPIEPALRLRTPVVLQYLICPGSPFVGHEELVSCRSPVYQGLCGWHSKQIEQVQNPP